MFLVCSSLIWFIDNLSESYIDSATFQLEYINVPDSLLLAKASKRKVDVKIQANGFQFLSFNIKNKSVNIDLSSMESKQNKYFIGQDVYRKQIDKQLRSMTLLEIDRDTLFFTFTQLSEKEVPVVSRVHINLSQNFILDGDIKIEPSTVRIKGPKKTIDTIAQVYTVEKDFPEETTNFAHKVSLQAFADEELTSFSSQTVFIYGKVARFSEKILEVPIKVINLPEGIEIRTFPDHVSILCRAKIDELKNLDESDFTVVADYNSIKDSNSKSVVIAMSKIPEGIHSAQMTEKQVEYILKRQ